MSDPNVPPPPPGFGVPPPPPPLQSAPPPPAWTGAASAPPQYGTSASPGGRLPGGPVQRVSGLAGAIRILFWVVTALTGLTLLAAFNRKSVWDGFQDDTKSLSDVDSADGLIAGALVVTVLAQLAAVIVLCVWSIRAARNANNLYGATTKPGLAGGSWFIPFANFIVPFLQLRNAFNAARLAAANLNLWQAMLILGAVVNFVGRQAGQLDVSSVSDVSGRLSAQVVWFTISFVGTALAAFFGSRAVMELSRKEDGPAGAI